MKNMPKFCFFSAIAVVATFVESKFRQGWDGRTYCFQLPAAQAEITLGTERTQELRVSALLVVAHPL
jgi:hypothetical protein